jgi:F0F1-type ATP synthase assembly protein I
METNPKKEPTKRKSLNDYGRFAGIGFQMLACIFLGCWLGFKADNYFNLLNPWLTIAGAIIGISIAMYWLFNLSSKK